LKTEEHHKPYAKKKSFCCGLRLNITGKGINTDLQFPVEAIPNNIWAKWELLTGQFQ
jgi:hypothetical protein